MNHPIYRITMCELIAPYSLRLRFNDSLARTIDFEPILEGELYGPLRDPAAFASSVTRHRAPLPITACVAAAATPSR